jgi:ATP-binding cassette subfamily C (CFTR/MRP) protein 1
MEGHSGGGRGVRRYVPQQPWIQNANVRDNILFGKPMDPRRYAATIKACALEADFDKFPDGDETEIGERGVNLSGGQKQRIALARAVYQNCGTMLLDDVLSALDSHVGAHVMDACLLDLLANTTRVLVTHKLDVLPAVDSIIVLGQGKVLAQVGALSPCMHACTSLWSLGHGRGAGQGAGAGGA